MMASRAESLIVDEITPAKILIVDDHAVNRDLLARRLVREGHHALEAVDGIEALEKLGQHRIDLVLLDIMMPRMDGVEMLSRMKANNALRHIPVIMITALDEIETAIHCIELGAEDHLTKPFNHTLLRARINAALEKKLLHDREHDYLAQVEANNTWLNQRVDEQISQIMSAQMGAIFAMSKLAESRDPETGEHLERMREYCRLLSQKLMTYHHFSSVIDEGFINNIYTASPLHDIGKVGVPDSVLTKPGKLDASEWAIMKQHSLIGAQTLREVDRLHPGNSFIRTGIDIAEGHHEKWDGTGYPYGRRGEEIPLVARILALGDVYDALTSKRCYKDPVPHDEVCSYLERERGRHFDPQIVDAFMAIEGEFRQVRTYFSNDNLGN